MFFITYLNYGVNVCHALAASPIDPFRQERS